jgi:hypothetical protein
MYETFGTHSGWAVRRDDGSYAEFLAESEAAEVAGLLTTGETSESDYEWATPEN